MTTRTEEQEEEALNLLFYGIDSSPSFLRVYGCARALGAEEDFKRFMEALWERAAETGALESKMLIRPYLQERIGP